MVFSRRKGQAAMTALVVCAALLAAGFLDYLWQRAPHYVSPARRNEMDAAELQRRRTGTIMIPEGAIGRCRRLKFDNTTGSMEDGGTGPCRDDVPANTPADARVNSIRDSFLNR